MIPISNAPSRRGRDANDAIQVLASGAVLVDYGPMRMVITAYEGSKPLTDLAKEGGRIAVGILADLAKFLPVIRKKSKGLDIEVGFPDVVRRMIEATQKMEEPDLTPLAAVAGAASDVVSDLIFSQGGSKIIVDNGGDIAIRMKEGEVAKVAIKTEIDARQPSYLLTIDNALRAGGIATSGLGGRSFTKGIASAATIVSESASLADAAATVVGNFTNVEDPSIRRTRAEMIYPDTDIAGEWVTTGVGRLSKEKVESALMDGLKKADSIVKRGLIVGALISVQGRVVWTDTLELLLTKIG
jgi:ApbE superfamily uncharacterized protein (UPF0280 family)